MRALPVDPEAVRAADEPCLCTPDKLGNLAPESRLINRLKEKIAAQAQAADPGRQPNAGNHLVKLLIIVIAVDEQGQVGRQAGRQVGVSGEQQPVFRQHEAHQSGIVTSPVQRVVS